MKWCVLLTGLLISCAAFAQATSLFSDVYRAGHAASPLPAGKVEAALFEKSFGVSSVREAVRQSPGPLQASAMLNSPKWQLYTEQMAAHFGTGEAVQQVLGVRESQLLREAKVHNVASTKSLYIKGNLAERLMDNYYRNSGWEKIDAKLGNTGIDGLYVKRQPNGAIKEWIVVDAKSGSSHLTQTAHGKQLSDEWIHHKLSNKLKSLEQEYQAAPNKSLAAGIDDFKALLSPDSGAKQRASRIFSCRIEAGNESAVIVRRNLTKDGQPVPGSRATKIDMRSMDARMVKKRNNLLNELKTELRSAEIPHAEQLVDDLACDLRKGHIKSDSDLYRFLRNKINNTQQRRFIAAAFGLKEQRAPLSKLLPLSLAKDLLSHSLDTANRIIVAVEPITSAIGRAQNMVVRSAEASICNILAKTMGVESAEKMAGKVLKGGLAAASGAVDVVLFAHSYMRYENGEISQRDLVVEGTLAAAGVGATLLTFSAGGSFAGPVGIGIGLVCGLASVGYSVYADYERAERIRSETAARSRWEVRGKEEHLKKRQQELKEESDFLIQAGLDNLREAASVPIYP